MSAERKISSQQEENPEESSWAEAHLEEWRIAKHRHKKKTNVESESSWLLSYADLMTVLVGFFALLLSLSSVEAKKFEKVKEETTKQFGGVYEKPYKKLADSIRQSTLASGLAAMVDVETDDMGVTITFRDSVFFDSSSAEVKPQAQMLLQRLIETTREQTKDFNIVIEGHTDSMPLRGKEFTNWELSGLRAARVVRSFQENGFEPDRLQGVGFGDTRPVVSEKDLQGDALAAGQARNRRVVVHLIKNFTEEKK